MGSYDELRVVKGEKMNQEINLDEFCDKYEAQEEKTQFNMYAKVIDDYSKLCGVDFRKENKFAHDDYGAFDSLLQLTVVQPKFFDEFHAILQKYGFNDKTYIDYAIKKITKNSSNVEAFINGLFDIGLISDVHDNEDNSICLKSLIGKYNFFPANEYYAQNKEIVEYIEKEETSRNCHVNTLFLLKHLKQGEAITAKCRNTMFNSFYYHSYYRFNGMICDLNINCVMREEEYNSIYNPKVISVVNIENLEEKQHRVKSNSKSTLEDLLEIAVYEEIKNSI